MSAAASWEPGTTLPLQTYRITRADLAAYAAASGDPNPIHLDEQVALAVGLPGVIAHGMYTLALAARAVGTWSDDAPVLELGAKFTAPVVVDAEQGAVLTVAGTVKDVADGVATLALDVRCGEGAVLGVPRARIRV